MRFPFVMMSVVVLSLAGGGIGRAEMRTWTDVSKRQIQAEFMGVEGNAVLLRMSNGQVHQVPMERLSKEDVAWAKAQAPQTPSAAASPSVLAPISAEQSAERIDRVVESHLASKGMKPNPALTDEQFLRRIYLDAVGRIPKYTEAVAFLEDKARDKRTKLIDSLVKSPGHASHFFNYYADMFRLKHRVSEYISGAAYIQWMKDNVAANKPYDVMVREMMTASGQVLNQPAAGYLMRDAGMPLDNLSITSGLFLGTDLSCAQCHDHPFEDWTQREFYQLAAFFATTRTTPDREMLVAAAKAKGLPLVSQDKIIEKSFEYRPYDGVVKAAMRRFMNSAQHQVVDNPKVKLKLPHDYKYKDGAPGEVVSPKVIFGKQPDLEKAESPRQAFAQWLTSDDNPKFAVTIANRMWKRAFGIAAVEPLLNIDLAAQNVKGLAEVLGEEMKRVHYDLQAFERILYHTRTYQRQASTTPHVMGARYDFAGPSLRRMSAAQVWDSILTMVLEDPDYFNGKRDYLEWEKTFSFDRSTIEGKTFGEKFAEMEALQKRDGGFFGWPRDSVETRPDGKGLYLDPRINAWRLYGDVLVRASELPQPAGAGHLLRSLGQSDRELADSDRTIGSVPIALALMNGNGSKVITKVGSRILDVVDRFKADGPKVDSVFLSMLSRLPSPEERSIAYKEIRQGDKKGFENVVWALLNTREFLFIQ